MDLPSPAHAPIPQIIPLQFDSHRFDWPFQLAPVSLPILGADFLRHHCLLLDVANQRVFCPASPGSPEISLTSSALSSASSFHANLLYTSQCISNLLSEFPDVLSFNGFSALPPDLPPPADTPWSSGEACLCQGRVQLCHVESRHSALFFSLVLSSPHGM